MKVGIGGDHAGYAFKEQIKKMLLEKGHQVEDFGPASEESCDYPDIAHPLAKSVENKVNDMGIAICGSGNGINMTLNKHKNVRGALCWTAELAELSRKHNNANIISIPSRFIEINLAIKCIQVFLATEFEGGRHERRVNKINI